MPTKVWQLQDAKNRFSEVINKALAEGPQVVTRRGEEVAVILSADEYNRLKKSKSSLREFFRESPLVGVDLEIERDQSYPRDTRL
ncbi:MAG: type II toxin-antitoxin system Phd/YefM family antitoxin [Anaerolineales bacterium]|jgi:antitoxin Phd